MTSEHPFIAFNVASTADSVTKTAVAVLTLISVAFVIVGLVRAWVGRRRPQVVIENIESVDGLVSSATSGLSPQLRQAVRQALLQESLDASYAVLKTLAQDIESGLLRTHGHVRMKTIAAGLRSTTEDSLTTLAAGVRAVTPERAEGLLAVLSVALPAQRGWVVRTFPILRGVGQGTEVGLTVELAQLGYPPDAVTTFWTYSGSLRSATSEAEQAAATGALLHRLLEPVGLWIATRLVSRQLAQSGVPNRLGLLSLTRHEGELKGLQLQLAGQMSLYATQKQRDFDRGFAGQALTDLAESARLLPEYFRPHSTRAAVHERLGWSYLKGGETKESAIEFVHAIRGYDEAILALCATSADAFEQRDAALGRAKVRRAKCRLLSHDRAHVVIANEELAELCQLTETTALALYNAACLFAIAMASPDVPLADRSLYELRAWHRLGLALLLDGADGPWTLTMSDVELEAMDVQQRSLFCDALKRQHPSLTPLSGDDARVLVDEAMRSIGIDPPAPTIVG